MLRSVFAVVESETSSVDEPHFLFPKLDMFFIQAIVTATATAPIDAEHSVLINQKLTKRYSPLLVVLNESFYVALWMGQLHLQQLLFDLWVQHTQLLSSNYLSHYPRILTLHLLGQVVNNLYFVFEDK